MGILIFSVIVTLSAFAALFLKKAIEEAKFIKENGLIPEDPNRLCEGPHDWESFKYVEVASDEDLKSLDRASEETLQEAVKELLACTKCGKLSGRDVMLGSGAVGRLVYKRQYNKFANRYKELYENKKAQVFSVFADKYKVSTEALEGLVLSLQSLPQEIQYQLHGENVQRVLENLKKGEK